MAMPPTVQHAIQPYIASIVVIHTRNMGRTPTGLLLFIIAHSGKPGTQGKRQCSMLDISNQS